MNASLSTKGRPLDIVLGSTSDDNRRRCSTKAIGNNVPQETNHDGAPVFRVIDLQTCQVPPSLTEPAVHSALQIFLLDMVMPEKNASSVSRGHFTNLSTLMKSSESHSTLDAALTAVAAASMAQRVRNPQLQIEGMRRYMTAVQSLRNTKVVCATDRLTLIMCIALLSLYEVICADDSSSQYWLCHVNGMMALLKDLVNTSQPSTSELAFLVLGTDPVNNIFEIDRCTFLQFDSAGGMGSLSFILTRVQKLFQDSTTIFQSEAIQYEAVLKLYRDRALSLREELLFWASMQPAHTRPTTVKRFTQPYFLRFPGASDDLMCPALRADTYPSYFTACRWNTYRQCQLHLTNLLHCIRRALSTDIEAYERHRDFATLRREVQAFIDDVCASIPFLLCGGKLPESRPSSSIWHQERPPMLIGGLNLQWLLFTISTLDIVPDYTRQDMKNILQWIGHTLGIGQALVLADLETNPRGGLCAKGDALRWVGFLI